jgi:hypothetical protein
MDIAIFIPLDTETLTSVGVAEFDMMGNEPPRIHTLDHSSEFFAKTLNLLVKGAERVWIGPCLEAVFDIEEVLFDGGTEVLDAETLFRFIPHVPHRYVEAGTPAQQVERMVERLRGCVSSLLSAGL